jgi:hypothetical protein
MNAPSPSSNGSRPLIARIWHGSTQAARADEYFLLELEPFVKHYDVLDAPSR